MSDHPRLAYLALEAPREGQASYTHVYEIVEGLGQQGWKVELFAPAYSHRWKRPPLGWRLFSYLRLQLRLAIMARGYDAIYIRAHFLAFPTTAYARIIGVPVIHEVNGPYQDLFIVYPWTRHLRGLFERMQRRQFRWAAGLIAVTPLLAEWLAGEAGHVERRVIPNGANTRLFRPAAARRQGLPDRYVVFFGGLTLWHGIDCLLAAASDPQWPTGISLVIVGDGAEREKTAAAAQSNDRIVVLGRLAYEEVPSVVVGALAGLVPISDPKGRSVTGLAPIKMFETLACGVPVIASELPTQADFVRAHGCGILFPTGDAHALAEAVRWLATHPETAREMGDRGASVVRQTHSWDHRAHETDLFLRQIIAKRLAAAQSSRA